MVPSLLSECVACSCVVGSGGVGVGGEKRVDGTRVFDDMTPHTRFDHNLLDQGDWAYATDRYAMRTCRATHDESVLRLHKRVHHSRATAV